MSRVLFPPNNNPTERGEIMMDDVVVAHKDGSVDSENKGVVNGHDLALADNHNDDEARHVDNEDGMALDDNMRNCDELPMCSFCRHIHRC